MRDNGSSGQGRNQKQTRVPSDWQASSSWFDERQERITKGSYSRQEQRPSQQSTKKAEMLNSRERKKQLQKEKKAEKTRKERALTDTIIKIKTAENQRMSCAENLPFTLKKDAGAR